MPTVDPPPTSDPLDDPHLHPDGYHGAILLSDQIQYYIKKVNPPLVQNPGEEEISAKELDDCLDAAAYKLRLGNEAHVGGQVEAGKRKGAIGHSCAPGCCREDL